MTHTDEMTVRTNKTNYGGNGDDGGNGDGGGSDGGEGATGVATAATAQAARRRRSGGEGSCSEGPPSLCTSAPSVSRAGGQTGRRAGGAPSGGDRRRRSSTAGFDPGPEGCSARWATALERRPAARQPDEHHGAEFLFAITYTCSRLRNHATHASRIKAQSSVQGAVTLQRPASDKARVRQQVKGSGLENGLRNCAAGGL